MDRLVKLAIRIIIGVLILYLISAILACIVLAVIVIVNSIIRYRKKHSRFTDWVYKNCDCKQERSKQHIKITRTYIFERFDRVLNTTEKREKVTVSELPNDGFSERLEWLNFKHAEQPLLDAELKRYYSS
jgi:hypothetical protein